MIPSVADALTLVEAALVTQMEEDNEALCFVGQTALEEIATGYLSDECVDCGAAWVRMVSNYPAASLGVPAEQAQGACFAGVGFDFEVGLVRCFSIFGDEDGNLPDVEVTREAAQQQARDVMTLRKVILCSGLDKELFRLAQWMPVTNGSQVGGMWLVQGILQ